MFNMQGNAVRLANVVGPLSTHGVIYDFITKIQSNPRYLEILGDGKQNKSYLYFDDCIDALILFLSIENKVGFELFNSGSNDAITVLEIAKIVIKDLALDDIDIIYQRNFGSAGWKGDIQKMLLHCSKIESLNWKPTYNSKEAATLAAKGTIRRLQGDEKALKSAQLYIHTIKHGHS